LSISDIGKSGVYSIKTSEFLTNEAIDKHNVKVIFENTVVVSFKLTVGKVAILNEAMATNEAIAHFNTGDEKLKEYVYFYLKTFNYEALGNTSSIGKAVNSKTIKGMPFIMPDKRTVEEFHSVVGSIFNLIRVNEVSNVKLTETRDSLLPKLMSGEIEV
ncbi:MAG: restriction endonuclease subunit S, partial [Anaerovoracaceae bacterium]